jgi:hypothetical protein
MSNNSTRRGRTARQEVASGAELFPAIRNQGLSKFSNQPSAVRRAEKLKAGTSSSIPLTPPRPFPDTDCSAPGPPSLALSSMCAWADEIGERPVAVPEALSDQRLWLMAS